jgi:hypothetical protein
MLPEVFLPQAVILLLPIVVLAAVAAVVVTLPTHQAEQQAAQVAPALSSFVTQQTLTPRHQ